MQVLGKQNYSKHVLVCVNERTEGDCCKSVQGQEVYSKIKQWVKENGRSDIWVTRTRCLGFCNPIGTTVVIYPEQIWFSEVRLEETGKIIELIK